MTVKRSECDRCAGWGCDNCELDAPLFVEKGLDMEQELPPLTATQADRDKAESEWEQYDGLESITLIEFLKCRERQLIETSKALELLCRFVAGTDRWESKRDEMLEMARRQLGKEK